MKLKGKVALVTGAAGGIGRAIVERLANEGADVAVVDLQEESVQEVVTLVEGKGRRALGMTVDVSNKSQVDAMVSDVIDKFERIDIFFNNAGIVVVQDFLDINSRGDLKRIRQYKEYFFDIEFNVLDITDNGIVDNTQIYTVPKNHFFVL